MLKVFNTLTKEKEEFREINKNTVSFYHCGPTVYSFQHIGNMRGMLMGDLIRRVLIYLGYQVKYVRNYTDFGHLTSDSDFGEDKMEKAYRKEHINPELIADKYINQFEKDTNRLNMIEPTIKARATKYIDEMIEFVKGLIDKGYAYITPKAIYFNVSKFDNYTKLSGQKVEKNVEGLGVGVVNDKNKKNPYDFALWFFRTGEHKNALQYWASPFKSSEVENGYGFPGWHIECSSMIKKELGETIDIHMGGIEHISIHHTNEIAQSESLNGVKFVNYWLHNEHLNLNNKKISKSDGNFILLDEIIEKKYDSMHLRYLFLQSHYRSKQNFTYESLEASKVAYNKLISNLYNYQKSNDNDKGKILNEWKTLFIDSIEDDFNIPKALSIVWDLIKSKENDIDKYFTIIDFDKVLGLKLEENMKSFNNNEDLTDEIKALLEKRNIARINKQWDLADSIRKELKDKYNYEVIDVI